MFTENLNRSIISAIVETAGDLAWILMSSSLVSQNPRQIPHRTDTSRGGKNDSETVL